MGGPIMSHGWAWVGNQSPATVALPARALGCAPGSSTRTCTQSRLMCAYACACVPVQEAKAQAAAEKHRQKEIERRMHPRTAADFEILYNELEAWRLQVRACHAQ